MKINIKELRNIEFCAKLIKSGLLDQDGQVLYFSKDRDLFLMNYSDALATLDNFGEQSMSVMMGKTDFLVVFPEESVVTINNEDYLFGECMIMKSDHGLKSLEYEELVPALREYSSRMLPFRVGQFQTEAYRLD